MTKANSPFEGRHEAQDELDRSVGVSPGAAGNELQEGGGDAQGGIISGMRGSLVHNNRAGGTGNDPGQLIELLAQAGIDVEHVPTDSPQDLSKVRNEPGDFVVVAGGDGTFREAAKWFVGTGVPLVHLPMGTANNVSRGLGIARPVPELIRELPLARLTAVDVAWVRGSWGRELLVEGAGLGAFANMLSAYDPSEGKNLLRAAGVVANELGSENPVHCRLDVDGQLIEGEYLMVQVMNTPAVGPRLTIGDQASPLDGLLDVVLIRFENRDAIINYVTSLVSGTLTSLPSVEVYKARRVQLTWKGSALHVDDQSLCKEAIEAPEKGFSAAVEVEPGALQMLLPPGDSQVSE